MQVRLSRELEDRARPVRAPLTVDEFLARFPEVPRDLRDEPALQEYTKASAPSCEWPRSPRPACATGAMPSMCSIRGW